MKNGARLSILVLGDILALFLAFCLMILVSSSFEFDYIFFKLHLFPFSILILLWLFIFFIFDLYNTHSTKPTIPYMGKIFMAFAVGVVLGIVFFYSFPIFDIAPKTNLAVFGGIGIVLFIIWRRIFYNIFSSYFKIKIAFLAKDKESLDCANALIAYIEKYPQTGLNSLGVHGSLEEFEKGFPQHDVTSMIIAKEIWQDSHIFKKISGTQKELWDLGNAYEQILGMVPIEIIDEGWFMHRVKNSNKRFNYFLSRALSVITALMVLILLSPIIFIIICAVKFYDGGSVFYSQTRVGQNGKKFKLYKFRSMREDAEKDGPRWSHPKDDRVTPIGKILRKTHLDEIPQMLNIIKGDIALVGPRPERPEFVEKLEQEIPFYHLRHTISPGFTGWAQIKFRYAGNVMDSKEKFKYDLYYLKNGNIFMDLGILLRTLQIIFKH